MFFNLFIDENKKNINISVKDNKSINAYVLSNKSNNINCNINVTLAKKSNINIYCLVLANNTNKQINFNIEHTNCLGHSNIYVKALADNKANIKIKCFSKNKTKYKKNIICQKIDGLIFDNKSTISTLPCLDINNNIVNAKHSVNIGQFNPEIIFYLNSRGLSNIEAYNFLINNFLKNLSPIIKKRGLNINKEIKNFLLNKFEHEYNN